jgi:hypothetical protein
VTDSEVDPGRRAVDRLTFFSDAVVAIAITLLAIDLPVPTGATVSQFWSSVRHNGGHYAAFAISFVAIAAAWDHHHDIFRYAQSMDSRVRTLNMAWLLTIVLNPFATKLLTSQGARVARCPCSTVRVLLAGAGAERGGVPGRLAPHGVAQTGAGHAGVCGDQHDRAVGRLTGRFRAVDTRFLRHHLRLGPLVRGAAGGPTGVPSPGRTKTSGRLARPKRKWYS